MHLWLIDKGGNFISSELAFVTEGPNWPSAERTSTGPALLAEIGHLTSFGCPLASYPSG